MRFKIDENDPDIGKRLDLYLSLHINEISRSNIKNTIESNKVKVNKEVCYKAGYKVKNQDLIEFPDIEQKNISYKEIPKSKFDLEIIFEDENYVFINKPARLAVHPTNQHDNSTLVNKLSDLYKDLPAFDFLRPGIVHRLDKDTTGVIAIAKNSRSLWWLSQQFANRKVEKEYVSIGLGAKEFHICEHKELIYEAYLARSFRDRKKFTVFKKDENKNARFSKSSFEILKIITLETEEKIILTKILPKTGRTHQIRVHQKELGFPIICDPIYLNRNQIKFLLNLFAKFKQKPRLFLHAHRLTFDNFDGKRYSIESEIPKEFNLFLENVEKIAQQTKDYKISDEKSIR